MLTTVEVRNTNGAMLPLSLIDLSNGFVIQEIQGLDPVQANIVSSGIASLDGEQYQSSRREKRNLIFKIGLEPDYVTQTVRQLRQTLYDYFMTKSAVSFRFILDDGPTVICSGRVESFDCPLFTAEPVATISVVCFDPDLLEETSTIFNSTVAATTTGTTLEYTGDVDSGILLTLTADRAIGNLSLRLVDFVGNVTQLDYLETLAIGDRLQISTVPGNKFIRKKLSGGSESSRLGRISPYSGWPSLTPGTNYISLSSATGVGAAFTVEYVKRYGGL